MGTAVQIQNIEESCFSRHLLLRLNAYMGCQIEDTQQERGHLEGNKLYTGQRFLDGCQGFLCQVESAIPYPVPLLASMTEVCCVFCQLSTRGVEILLGKLTKTKTDIQIQNIHFKVE